MSITTIVTIWVINQTISLSTIVIVWMILPPPPSLPSAAAHYSNIMIALILNLWLKYTAMTIFKKLSSRYHNDLTLCNWNTLHWKFSKSLVLDITIRIGCISAAPCWQRLVRRSKRPENFQLTVGTNTLELLEARDLVFAIQTFVFR